MKIAIDFFQKNFNEAIGSGVYQLSLAYNEHKRALYIGESITVMRRCATHLWELNQDPSYICLDANMLEDENITLTFELIESEDNEGKRKAKEKELIRERKPLTQSGIKDNQDTEMGRRRVAEFLKASGRV